MTMIAGQRVGVLVQSLACRLEANASINSHMQVWRGKTIEGCQLRTRPLLRSYPTNAILRRQTGCCAATPNIHELSFHLLYLHADIGYGPLGTCRAPPPCPTGKIKKNDIGKPQSAPSAESEQSLSGKDDALSA
ncbi:unnamed protein product, partial [Ectocarpus sp. 8 AP-2014]